MHDELYGVSQVAPGKRFLAWYLDRNAVRQFVREDNNSLRFFDTSVDAIESAQNWYQAELEMLPELYGAKASSMVPGKWVAWYAQYTDKIRHRIDVTDAEQIEFVRTYSGTIRHFSDRYEAIQAACDAYEDVWYEAS